MSLPHGILLIDKPEGLSSHDVVAQVRRKLKIKEVGHCGTLDPLATGLMIILLGEATKLSQFLLERDKAYSVQFRLGIETDTWDITGQVVKLEETVNSTILDVQRASQNLSGELELQVPAFSAIKVQGQKLYEMARKEGAENVQNIPSRTMDFKKVIYVGNPSDREFQFDLKCSKGSYVRSWVQTLGQQLKCGATMTVLRRTESQPYFLDDAIPLDVLDKNTNLESHKAFIPIHKTLTQFKIVRVKHHTETMIRNGQISYELKRQIISIFDPEVDLGVKVMTTYPDQLIALVVFDSEKGLQVRRVFRYT